MLIKQISNCTVESAGEDHIISTTPDVHILNKTAFSIFNAFSTPRTKNEVADLIATNFSKSSEFTNIKQNIQKCIDKLIKIGLLTR